MKKKAFLVFIITFTIHTFFFTSPLSAQDSDSKPVRDRKLEKETQQARAFTRTDSLLNSRQFVFKAENAVEVFVVVDSLFGEVQNGNRNNLQGHITQFEVKKNEKKKQLSLSFKMRGVMHTADVVLFMDASGKGKATVLSEFPRKFTFIGELLDFEDAWIYEGPSHDVH